MGQAPATGGRVRQYATAAERARAFRERQAATRGGPGDPGLPGPDDRPELAVASLAGVVASLQQLLGSAQAGMAEQVERAQAAVALLSDPAAIDERGALLPSECSGDRRFLTVERQRRSTP